MTTALVALILLGLPACGGGGSGSGGGERTVFVDYSSDEFASFVLANFPEEVEVRPGDTVVFKQTWTGEPHTVTGGKAVDDAAAKATVWTDLFKAFGALASTGAGVPDPDGAPPGTTMGDFARAVRGAAAAKERDAFIAAYEKASAASPLPALDPASQEPLSGLLEAVDKGFESAAGGLPSAFGEDDLTQNGAQPCYLREGLPPSDEDKPCADAAQKQPPFDGRFNYYNSGVIPYQGSLGNTFEVEVADDAVPGTYLFYCAIHGFDQSTRINIKESGASVPSESEVRRAARREIDKSLAPLEKIFRDAEDGTLEMPGPDGKPTEVSGPFAGLPGGEVHGAINEFLPKSRTVKVNEPITWKMMGSDHTISFGVPKYFPIMEFADNGNVRVNPKLQPPAGGATPVPEDEEGGGGGGGGGPQRHDAGTYDGRGFWSSGLIGGQPYLEFTMRISKPGTYPYACLLHPPMVGTIVVKA